MAFTNRLIVGPVQVAPVRKGVSTGLRVGTRTLPARNVHLQGRVTIESVKTDITVDTIGSIPTAVAVPCQGITSVSMAVTLTRLNKNNQKLLS